ncbi:hypothetical protein SDC9_56207 [bioreactor metagenome]|uniref:Uncharacterized protein n=1 Tax=bioreactor metagenome TaxID=1076179 RepID=A0A644X6V5_9ZZZZ
MSAEAVGNNIQQNGAFALCQRELTLVSVDHGERVEAVHALCMHGGRHYAGSDARHHVVPHRFAAGLSAHTVEVVVNIKDNRNRAAVLAPECTHLVHGGDHEAFPNGAAGHGAVADVADDHARFFVDEFKERRARSDAAAAADDGVVRVDAKRRKERVHRTAKSLIEAVFAGKGFAHHAVQQEVDANLLNGLAAVFDHGKRSSVKEVFHDGGKLFIVQNLNGAQTLGKYFAVAAVGTKGIVVQREFVRRADIRRFLTDT